MLEEREAIVHFLIGGVLCVAIVVSYVPQHFECWQLRSAQGLSLLTLLISTFSCVAATLSSLLGDWHAIRAAALSQVSTSEFLRALHVINASMPTCQNALTVVFGTPTYVLYYFWFAHRELVTLEHSRIQLYVDSSLHRLDLIAVASTWLSVAVATAASIWVLVVFDTSSLFSVRVSKFWGILAAVTNTIQWIPQIGATWSARHEGVLSVASMIISVLVDVFVAAFWIAGPKEPMWIYMSLATDAILQILLIGMILFFRMKRRQNERSHEFLLDDGLSHRLLVPVNDSALIDNIPSESTE
jgi:uncharacterized protein with PQ loop repeat